MRVLVLMALLAGCSKSSLDSKVRQPVMPGDTDTDTDSDTDSDADTDADSDADTDTDTDTDLGDAYASLDTPGGLGASMLTGIEADIDYIRYGTSASSGVYVVDADNGQVVYAANEDSVYKPASNTKLFTSGAAFDLLGEDYSFTVTASASSPIQGGSVSDLYVVIEHDLSWSTFFYDSYFWPADRLADALYDAGLRSVSGDLVVMGEGLVEGYQFAYYDAATHRSDAAWVLEDALVDRGISVGSVRTQSGFTPSGSTVLARRESLPLSTLMHPVNDISHNEMADITVRHLGFATGGSSTYGDGTGAVLDWLAGAGVSTTNLELYDGSGLSHDNRVSPRSIVEMQEYMLERPSGVFWNRTFSIAGVSGTLGYRMTGGDTSGRFFGKTGTLNGVIATSGYLLHRHDGHRYLIGILFNDVVDQSYARALQDDIVEVVARDWRVSGGRPETPVLQAAVGQGDGTALLQWSTPAGVDAVEVWLSRDGRSWSPADGRKVVGDRHLAGGLSSGRHYVRLTSRVGPLRSDPSDAYAFDVGSSTAPILVVDGNDRWEWQGENAAGIGHDFVVDVASAISRRVDSVSNEAVVSGLVDLSDYDAVIWLTGEESTTDESLDHDEQTLIASYLSGGGNLLISGAEIAWDLDPYGDGTDQAFFGSWLKAGYAGDDADTYVVRSDSGLFAGLGDIEFYTPATMVVSYPDQLSPAGGSTGVLSYIGGAGGTAGVHYRGGYGLVYLGFPVESIVPQAQRRAVLDRVLADFGL